MLGLKRQVSGHLLFVLTLTLAPAGDFTPTSCDKTSIKLENNNQVQQRNDCSIAIAETLIRVG